MCRYRYQFFGSCLHGKLILLDFCQHAPPLHDNEDAAPQSSDVLPATGRARHYRRGRSDEWSMDRIVENTEEVAPTDNNNNNNHITHTPSAFSKPSTHSSLFPGSSFDTGSVSITAEPDWDRASLRQDRHSHPSPVASSSHGMAGLPLFGETFRQWMSGNGPQALKPSGVDAKDHVFMTSKKSPTLSGSPSVSSLRPRSIRKSGIRENTDDSWILPTGNDILQHLAESYCTGKDQHIGIDSQRSPSDASTACTQIGRSEPQHDVYDSIEAEIDQLKQDVSKLRQAADRDHPTLHGEQESTSNKRSATRAGRQPPSANSSNLASAAALLQRQHEAIEAKSRPLTHRKPEIQPSFSPLEFPVLGETNSHSKSSSPTHSGPKPRKPSYADAATTGMLEAIDSNFSANMGKRKPNEASVTTSDELPSVVSMTSQSHATSSVVTQDSYQHRMEDDCSVVVSPLRGQIDSAVIGQVTRAKDTQATVNGKPIKESPHFARPTQSFSRRAGETLRSNAASQSPKTKLEGSPTRSGKAKQPDFATDQRATLRQAKRKSLPCDWISTHPEQTHTLEASATGVPKFAATTPENCSSPVSQVSHSSTESWQVTNWSPTRDSAEVTYAKVREVQAHSPLRKKTSSYMSPTTAATQRTIATLGQGQGKRKSLPTKETKSQAETAEEQCTAVPLPRSCTMSSDQSSVQFILEQDVTSPSQIEQKFADTPARKEILQQRPVTVTPSSQKASPTPSPQKKAHRIVSRIPQPSSQVRRQALQGLVSGRNAQPSALPTHFAALSAAVPNTTMKRRMSHGHILLPIVNRLHSNGLLNKTSANDAIVDSYLQDISNELTGTASGFRTGQHSVVAGRPNNTSSSESTYETSPSPSKRPLAPQFRESREASRGSTATDLTIGLDPAILCITGPNKIMSPICVPDASNALTITCSDNPAVQRASSLRATAHEFKPMKSPDDGMGQSGMHADLSWKSPEQWGAMDTAQKLKVVASRNALRSRAMLSTNTFATHQTPPEAPFRSPARHSWTNFAPPGTHCDPTVKFVNDDGSPNQVQVGQILRPGLSPGKKNVQWMLQDLDGKETPIRMGRAAIPTPPSAFEASTPSLSSHSNDTSPFRTPHSQPQRQWHIGSALSRSPFGWTGGDGKEIRFIGYGPHAERDPNNFVNFTFQGHMSSHNVSVPNGFVEDKENFAVDVPVVPKSQRQWAEKLGYHRVPCGNVDVVDAVEVCVPFGSGQLGSYCYDCVPGH